jgi:hydroxymethylglutaryl-CoA reductase
VFDGGTVILRIISNLAVHRLARVSAVFSPEEISDKGDARQGSEVIDGVLQAYHFAKADPFRATTHNKGIMNAISPVAIACGQDWRAVESGAHSFAAHERVYGSLTHWEKDGEGNLVGSIELPMAVGLVGGAVRVHPAAQANVALLGITSADELAKVMAAAGLAQNLGALRALAEVIPSRATLACAAGCTLTAPPTKPTAIGSSIEPTKLPSPSFSQWVNEP